MDLPELLEEVGYCYKMVFVVAVVVVAAAVVVVASLYVEAIVEAAVWMLVVLASRWTRTFAVAVAAMFVAVVHKHLLAVVERIGLLLGAMNDQLLNSSSKSVRASWTDRANFILDC